MDFLKDFDVIFEVDVEDNVQKIKILQTDEDFIFNLDETFSLKTLIINLENVLILKEYLKFKHIPAAILDESEYIFKKNFTLDLTYIEKDNILLVSNTEYNKSWTVELDDDFNEDALASLFEKILKRDGTIFPKITYVKF